MALIAEGKTIEDALISAMKQLGVTDKTEIEYEIKQDKKGGFLGLFGKPAVIRAWVKSSETSQYNTRPEPVTSLEGRASREPQLSAEETYLVERAHHHLQTILEHMGFNPTITHHRRNGVFFFNIDVEEADKSGILIGKKGQTLGALQHIINRLIGLEEHSETIKIVLDVSGYRYKRDNFLRAKAQSLAATVKAKGEEVMLSPLHSSDRRVVHATLSEDPNVRTYTVGEGLYRNIVIAPNKQKRNGVKAASKPPKPKRHYEDMS